MTDQDAQVKVIHLPRDLEFTYLAEGAANVVYKITVKNKTQNEILPSEIHDHGPATPSPTELETWEVPIQPTDQTTELFRGKLLRLRKDRAYSVSPLQSQRDFERLIKPLFEADELVQSAAIELTEQLIVQLNADLRALERLGKRPSNRCGLYLRQEAYGTIVDDISYGMGFTAKVLELKPKWLLQSPTAPKDAVRCRTCALRRLKAANELLEEQRAIFNGTARSSNDRTESIQQPKIHNHDPLTKTGFCPLDLVSQSKTLITKAMRQHLSDTSFTKEETYHIVNYLSTSTLLQKLKHLQSSLQDSVLLQTDPTSTAALILMTLRDCSLFLTLSSNGVTDARLGDLDLKSASRAEHWNEIERQLVQGGWYEQPLDGTGHIRCALER